MNKRASCWRAGGRKCIAKGWVRDHDDRRDLRSQHLYEGIFGNITLDFPAAELLVFVSPTPTLTYIVH